MTVYKIGKNYENCTDCDTLDAVKEKAKELGDGFTVWYRQPGKWWYMMLVRADNQSFWFVQPEQSVSCKRKETLDQALEKLYDKS